VHADLSQPLWGHSIQENEEGKVLNRLIPLAKSHLVGLLAGMILGALPMMVTAAPPIQTASCDQEHTVQTDDWLSKLAEKYMGDKMSYPAIVDATNRMHESDKRFAQISDADHIDVGWILCIPSSPQAAGGVERTQVTKFVPQIPDGESHKGKCPTHSRVWGREDAWHCSMDDGDILDPCFSVEGDGGETVVVCGADPVDDAMAKAVKPFTVELTEPLPSSKVSAQAKELLEGNGWKLVMADGGICHFVALAEPMTVDDKAITYHCAGNDRAPYLWIAADLKPGEVWTAQQYVAGMGDDGPAIKEPQTVEVRIVWQ